jgi:two-component system osmolarity sensor histidine kinase EnvZ
MRSNLGKLPLSVRDGAELLLLWLVCAGLSGLVLFQPLRELLEPQILEESADRIESKVRLAEIALETRDLDELPSPPLVVASSIPKDAHGRLTPEDLELVEALASGHNLRRRMMVDPPERGQFLPGYWIRLEVENKPGSYWLNSRSALGLSTWFMPAWRTLLLLLGVLLGTLLYLQLKMNAPLMRLLSSMERTRGRQFELIPPQGMNPVRRLIQRINELYEQINTNDQSRRRLLRTISHDLRSPLTRLQVRMELGQTLETSNLEGDLALLRVLAEEISILADAADGSTGPQDFLLDQFCRRLAASYRPGTVDLSVPAWIVHLDQAGLQRSLNNLIDNALEYGRPPVRIGAELDGKELVITVVDHGEGLPTLSILTMPLEPRSDDRGQQRHSGLGLQSVESFCRNAGGRLSLDRAPEGGLRASLRLPLGCLRR